MTQGEISLVATQHSIMYALLAAKSPMTRAAIVKAANLGSKSGSHMKRAFDALEDSGMVEKIADGYKATQKASDEFNQVEGDEDAGSVIGAGAEDAPVEESPVVAEAEAVLEQQAKTPSPAEAAAADADRLTDIAASVIEYDPALLSPPLGVKAEIATLSKEDRATVRKIVIGAPGTTSAENGARFTQLGLLTKDDVVKAEAEKKVRETKKAEKKERAPKAANPNAPFMLAFTGSYKAREGGVCHIIGRAVATSAKKTVPVEDVLAALKAERPEDGEKYLKEGVRLLVTRNVITEVTNKEGVVTGYATTADVKKMVGEQLKAREAAKAAPAK